MQVKIDRLHSYILVSIKIWRMFFQVLSYSFFFPFSPLLLVLFWEKN